eukprot:COSAG01_NODE_9222_length_2514_cov_1.659213_5_plen_116_part_00
MIYVATYIYRAGWPTYPYGCTAVQEYRRRAVHGACMPCMVVARGRAGRSGEVASSYPCGLPTTEFISSVVHLSSLSLHVVTCREGALSHHPAVLCLFRQKQFSCTVKNILTFRSF